MRKFTLSTDPFLLLKGTIRGGSFLAVITLKYNSLSKLIFSSGIPF